MGEPPAWSLRPGALADAPALAALGRRMFAEAHRDAFLPEDLELALDRDWSVLALEADLRRLDTTIFVAEAGGGPAGLVAMRPGPVPGGDAVHPVEFCRFYLDAPWIGKGMGGALFAAAMDWFETSSHDVCWLSAWEHNDRALALYRARGFRQVRTYPYVVGGSRPTAVLMVREHR